MANTTNLNLAKPAGKDKALVSVLNSNSDKIDAWAGSTNQAISNIRQNEIVIPITENTDLNTLTTPGYYNLYGAKSLVNAPASGANRLGLLVQRAESTQYVYQIATDNVNDATGVYVRSCKGGTWSAWQQLALKSETLTKTTEPFQYTDGNYTLNGRVSKIGKSVFFEFFCDKNIPDNTLITTLPAGYRPNISNYPQLILIPDPRGQSKACLQITNDGKVTFKNPDSTTVWTFFTAMYFNE